MKNHPEQHEPVILGKSENSEIRLHYCGDDIIEIIFNPKNKEIKGLKIIESNETTLKIPGQKIFVNGPKATLVPSAIFDPSIAESFLSLTNRSGKGKIWWYRIKSLDSFIVFQIDIENVTGELFHEDTGWLEALAMKNKLNPATEIYVDFGKETISIAAFRTGALELYNVFTCISSEDKLYFTLFISDQLRFSPLRDAYFLTGAVNEDSEDFLLFKKYIANLSFADKPFSLIFANGMIPEHRFFKSYCTVLCE